MRESNPERSFTRGGFERYQAHGDSYSLLVDVHSEIKGRQYYLQVMARDLPQTIAILDTAVVHRVLKRRELGLLLRVEDGNCQYTVWLPSAPTQLSFDSHQRIAPSNRVTPSYRWELKGQVQLHLLHAGKTGEVIVPYLVLKDPHGELFQELESLGDLERRVYRKSNWFSASTPRDVWTYLINGSVYDPRSDKRVAKRFKCQQCAYAWWSYFDFLNKETGKKIHAMMRDEIALTVLLDMSPDGAWRHGFWSDAIETHARFHLDGLHLLLSQYEQTDEPMWLEAVERGMAFVLEHLAEQLDDGSVWFLHDTIEASRRHHFKSTLFGKTPGNSLCINTHVQALTVLHRLSGAVPDKPIYAKVFDKGLGALRRALDHQPGELLYRPLISWIMKNKARGEARYKWGRVRNSLEKRLLMKLYWSVQRKYPRLVQPGGFTERDLTLSFASDRYHVINVKDFLTLYRQVPLPWLRSYIQDGTAFVRTFVRELGLAAAVASSPYYIELVDILLLFDELIEPVPSEEISSVEADIYRQTGGYSLDFYASELVRRH